ncbi:MAG: hypothetical protein AB7E85_01330 [Pseudobdellovibrionaceae bacterium]
MRNKLCFTDLMLLNALQRMYENDFAKKQNDKTGFYVPIDCKRLAEEMKVDAEMVFQRLNFHLNKKYSYKQDDGSKVEFFAFEIGGIKHCINYPYLCAILAQMEDDQKELRHTKIIAIIAIVISVLGLFVGTEVFSDIAQDAYSRIVQAIEQPSQEGAQ